MSVEILECEQYSEAWIEARLGILTASVFSDVLAKSRTKGESSKSRLTLMCKLIGEQLLGRPSSEFAFTNEHTERGHQMEGEARDLYAMLHNVEPQQVGFIRNHTPFGIVGCSPDSVIGDNGLLEIKTQLPHLQIATLLDGDVPKEHIAQLQGQLFVAEREWVDLLSYWPGLKPFQKRVYRDEAYLATLKVEIEAFYADMAQLMERINAL